MACTVCRCAFRGADSSPSCMTMMVACRHARRDSCECAVPGTCAEPVPVPGHPTPANQRVVNPLEPTVHLAAAPPSMWSERPARRRAAKALNPVGRRGQFLSQCFRRQQHVSARRRVQANCMSLAQHSPDDRGRLVGDVPIDEKECRPHLFPRKHTSRPGVSMPHMDGVKTTRWPFRNERSMLTSFVGSVDSIAHHLLNVSRD